MTKIILRDDSKRLGLLRYYTGVPCKNGHDSERITSSKKCVQCNREWQRLYLKRNPEHRERTLKRLESLDKTKQKNGWSKLNVNKNKKNEYRKKDYQNNKFKYIMRCMVRRAITGKLNKSTELLLGYSADKLRQRLECQFKHDMSFDNYGKWHIDHKKPLSAFTKDKAMLANMLCNLQPLWANDNIRKSNKF